MKMTFRWFGEHDDAVPLRYIAQIPNISGVVTSLLDIPAGDVWSIARIRHMRDTVRSAGLTCEVIESVNVHESIKLGAPERDEKIENYIKTLRNLHEFGIKAVCYNFMPVLDWVRSHLYFDLPDGSKTMMFSRDFIENTTPELLAARYAEDSGGVALPGWEPERLLYITDTIARYADMTDAQYVANAEYFLDAVIPYAERYDIKMAIHPDDPPTKIFGLPRLVNDADSIARFLALHDSPYNGLTLCTGSLGANPQNDVAAIAARFTDRIHFAHIRNLQFVSDTDFYESSHQSGSLNIYGIVRALADNGFDGYVRPDHGRMIWGEADGMAVSPMSRTAARPGYGLYDRALGAAYLNGLWDAVTRGRVVN
ncbi:MAG: mannonate dehydratase [Oscillospiraceae bacterium]|jgi:mannonate dehydratase|nr:mannonate dehydratase [Oscillospiraceae bacterium]